MPVLADIPLFFDQTFVPTDLAAVLVLVILEGVLSIDNALVLGLLAKRLPRNEQGRALWYGLAGAVVFRCAAVLFASFLLRWTFAKFLGGAYLVYIAVKHLFFESHETEETKMELDEHGHPKLVDEEGGPPSEEAEELEIRGRAPVYLDRETRKRLGLASFWPTVLIIELTDIAFAVDSILAALAFVGSPPPGHPPEAFHPKLWLVIFGGLIGVALMRVAASMFIKLLEKFPRFETSAYLLVIVIGLKLLADWGVKSDWSFDKATWMPPAWKQTFEGVEESRRSYVHGYEDWLNENWIFPPKDWEQSHAAPEKPAELPPPEGEPAEAEAPDHDPRHTPHLLNFHQLTRPESLLFWSSMLICFGIGFIPKRSKQQAKMSLGEQSD
jgi:YkoY family integral membrane protein